MTSAPREPAIERVEFLFDFGSPNAYLCHKVVPMLEARTGVRFVYVPILLGGLFKLANNRAPAEAFADIPTKRAYDRLEVERFVAKHGLTRFRPNPFFPVNTLKIMRIAVAAEALDCAPAVIGALYAGMWEDGLKLDEPAQIAAVLAAAGLDGPALVAKSQEPEIKARLVANTQSAFERGAFGSPSFFLGDDLYFGKERLHDIEERVLAERG